MDVTVLRAELKESKFSMSDAFKSGDFRQSVRAVALAGVTRAMPLAAMGPAARPAESMGALMPMEARLRACLDC